MAILSESFSSVAATESVVLQGDSTDQVEVVLAPLSRVDYDKENWCRVVSDDEDEPENDEDEKCIGSTSSQLMGAQMLRMENDASPFLRRKFLFDHKTPKKLLFKSNYKDYLKYDPDQEIERNRKALRFSKTVEVKNIPSHCDYSPEEHSGMWTNLDELRNEGIRDTIEMRFDGGRDNILETATEEDDFRWLLLDSAESVLVHPATYYSFTCDPSVLVAARGIQRTWRAYQARKDQEQRNRHEAWFQNNNAMYAPDEFKFDIYEETEDHTSDEFKFAIYDETKEQRDETVEVSAPCEQWSSSGHDSSSNCCVQWGMMVAELDDEFVV